MIHGVFKLFSPNLGVRGPFKFEKLSKVVVLIWPGMARLTFFPCEITQKLFFLVWGFHILAAGKKYFCHPGGSQWAPGGLLARFKAKNPYFVKKRAKRPPGSGPLGPPRMTKIIFSSCQDMKTPCYEEFSSYLP